MSVSSGSPTSIQSIQSTVTVIFDPGHELGNLGTVTRIDRVMNVIDGTIGVENMTRVRNVVDGTLSTVQRVQNIVDGTLTAVTGVDRVRNLVDGTLSLVSTVTRADRVMNLVDGTITFIPTVQRVQNVVDGTLTTLTGADRVRNVVDGTLSTVSRVSNVVDGTLSLLAMTQRVNNLVDGTLSLLAMAQRVNNLVDGTLSLLTMAQRVNNVVDGTLSTVVRITNLVNGTVTANAGTGTFTVKFDPGYTLGKVDAGIGTFNVKLDPGYTLGKVDQGVRGTAANAWFTQDVAATAVIPNFSAGQVTGVSVSGNTIAAPAASAVRKIYAYSLTTSATLSNIVANFTNGSGASPTKYSEDWLGSTPARLAVTPPGFLWAVPANTTLSLLISNAAGPTHYNVYWFNESA